MRKECGKWKSYHLRLQEWLWPCSWVDGCQTGMGEMSLYFRLDIILVKGLSKHTLITYFQIDLKYAIQHFFVYLSHLVLSKICKHAPKHTFFLQFCTFCTPKGFTHVNHLGWKNKHNYMIFTRTISNFKYKCQSRTQPEFCKGHMMT